MRHNVEEVIAQKSERMAPQLLEDIETLSFELERLEDLIGFILYLDKDFANISWKNSNGARTAINREENKLFMKHRVFRVYSLLSMICLKMLVWIRIPYLQVK